MPRKSSPLPLCDSMRSKDGSDPADDCGPWARQDLRRSKARWVEFIHEGSVMVQLNE